MERERGFDAFRKKIEGKTKFIQSCSSCMFMEEYCINTEVTEFDMVVTESNRYCSFWRGYQSKKRRNKNDE